MLLLPFNMVFNLCCNLAVASPKPALKQPARAMQRCKQLEHERRMRQQSVDPEDFNGASSPTARDRLPHGFWAGLSAGFRHLASMKNQGELLGSSSQALHILIALSLDEDACGEEAP